MAVRETPDDRDTTSRSKLCNILVSVHTKRKDVLELSALPPLINRFLFHATTVRVRLYCIIADTCNSAGQIPQTHRGHWVATAVLWMRHHMRRTVFFCFSFLRMLYFARQAKLLLMSGIFTEVILFRNHEMDDANTKNVATPVTVSLTRLLQEQQPPGYHEEHDAWAKRKWRQGGGGH